MPVFNFCFWNFHNFHVSMLVQRNFILIWRYHEKMNFLMKHHPLDEGLFIHSIICKIKLIIIYRFSFIISCYVAFYFILLFMSQDYFISILIILFIIVDKKWLPQHNLLALLYRVLFRTQYIFPYTRWCYKRDYKHKKLIKSVNIAT